MEIKVNFLCRDSILAAPIALDLVMFSDLAMRAGMCGIQTWLSFFCKSPMHDFEHQPEHDLFVQWRMVKQTLRQMIGEKNRLSGIRQLLFRSLPRDDSWSKPLSQSKERKNIKSLAMTSL